jgi:hypothetical protein
MSLFGTGQTYRYFADDTRLAPAKLFGLKNGEGLDDEDAFADGIGSDSVGCVKYVQ